jgi:hypothetical protein
MFPAVLENPDFMIGAVHFEFDELSNGTELQGFVIQTNMTVSTAQISSQICIRCFQQV